MTTKRFSIRDEKEIPWIKTWFRGQVVQGRMSVALEAISEVRSVQDARRLINRELDLDGRTRLQKALSARRRRSENENPRTVTTEMDREARGMLLAVAAAKGISVSELIKEYFEEDYMALQ